MGRASLVALVIAACGRPNVDLPITVVCTNGVCGDSVVTNGDGQSGDGSGGCQDSVECTTPGPCESLPGECVQFSCVYPPADGNDCDDGNSCTDPDSCSNRECVGYPIVCGSAPAAACQGETYHYWTPLGGCDPTNGECYEEQTLDCSPDCQLNCLEACNALACEPENGGCRIGACEPGSLPATCIYSDANEGTRCDRTATLDGYCVAGECFECRDSAHCPACHICTDAHVCAPGPASAPCDDGLHCNGSDSCGGEGTCNVHSGDPCPGVDGDGDCSESCNETNDTCTANDPPGSSCDDSLHCNGSDTCNATGSCATHSGDPCAAQIGDGDGDCSEACDETNDDCSDNDPPGSNCDDDQYCNGTDTCNALGACSNHSGDPCAARVGDNDADCSESCDEGTDSCIANDPPDSFCNDSDPCNGTDSCNSSGSCNQHSGDPCASQVGDGDADCTEACNPTTGACTAADPPGASCNLTDPCISGESCSSGVCVGTGCTGGLLCSPGVGCRDPDLNQGACESAYTWIDAPWDTSLFGTPECCGDDAGENEQQKVVYWGAWQAFNRQEHDVWACCASTENCANDAPIRCYVEGSFAGPTQLCVNGAFYNCNVESVCFEHFADVPNERCLETGTDTYAWTNVSGFVRDGPNPREGTSYDDDDYPHWGDTQYVFNNGMSACCAAASDCVNNGGVCRAHGFVITGTTQWVCDGGDWYECGPLGAAEAVVKGGKACVPDGDDFLWQ